MREIDGFLIEKREIVLQDGSKKTVFACSSPEGGSLFSCASEENAADSLSKGLVIAMARRYPKKSAVYDEGASESAKEALWHPEAHRDPSKALRISTWDDASAERRRIMAVDGDLEPIGPFLPEAMEEYLNKFYPLPRRRFPESVRDEVYAMFGGRCAYCGEGIPKGKMQVDHIESRYLHLGKDDISNYYPACALCNRVKSFRTMEEFRRRIRTMAEWYRSDPPWAHRDNDAAKIALRYGLDKEDKEVEFYFEKVNGKVDNGGGGG